MITIIERTTPVYLKMLEALKRRVPDTHPSKRKILEKYHMQLAGFRGEKMLDYYLTIFPKENAIIIPNLRLPNKSNYYFQMDATVLTPKYILIIESKYYSGDLEYDVRTSELSRGVGEWKTTFEDPIMQVERQKLQLIEILHNMKVPVIPIIPIVTLTNSNVSLKIKPEHAKPLVSFIKVGGLPLKLTNIDKSYTKEYIDFQQIKKISRQLLKKRVEYEPNVLEKFNLKKEELIRGVHCPSCFAFEMTKRKKGIWFCEHCLYSSSDAFLYSLNDYRLIIGKQITNRDFRFFLNINANWEAKRLLAKTNAIKKGFKKAAFYELQHYEP